MCDFKSLGMVCLCAWAATTTSLKSAESVSTETGGDSRIVFETPKASLWEEDVGQGFSSSARSFAVEAGAAKGIAVLGGSQRHDLALLSLSYGHMLGHTVGSDHFYKGNWELRLELFGGSQFAPTSDWVVGVTPHLRYNFATGTRLVPFVDGGAGVTATSISAPDLSNTFEFNLQATLGVHWFIRDDLALTLEVRYLHFSCAGISDPNRGVNGVAGLFGLTFFF